MGIGMVVVCDPSAVADVQGSIPEETWIIGELVVGTAGARTVHLLT
jgi:phosphoribosylaminoimidazole (AIR) synthetase